MKHYIVNLSSFTNEKATELYKALTFSSPSTA